MPRPIEENRKDLAEMIVLNDALRHADDRWRPSSDTPPELTIEVANARERLAWRTVQIRADHVAKAQRYADKTAEINAALPAEKHWPLPTWVRAALSQN